MKNACLVLMAGLLLAGCATNGFRQFYHDQTHGADFYSFHDLTANTGQPELIEGNDPQKTIHDMMENGYVMMGYSSFHGPLEDESKAVAMAKELHADVVVVYSSYANTRSGAMPIQMPTTQTSYSTANLHAYGSNGAWANAYGTGTTTTYGTQTTYMPYSVEVYNQDAQYFIKKKPGVVGLYVADLSESKRRQIASNQGIEVKVVTKGSPAFRADIMEGDVIKKIDGKEIATAKDYYEMLPNIAGKTVVIQGLRDGKPYKKTVKLNEKPVLNPPRS